MFDGVDSRSWSGVPVAGTFLENACPKIMPKFQLPRQRLEWIQWLGLSVAAIGLIATFWQ